MDELADRISVMRDGEIIDSRLAEAITPAEIVALIAGRPLGQIFPAKAKSVGAPLFAVKALSGRGLSSHANAPGSPGGGSAGVSLLTESERESAIAGKRYNEVACPV